jgi:hypothetical protein
MTIEYEKAEVKFNNGAGARLCNQCGYIISYGFDHTDSEAFCGDCYSKLYRFIHYIATDYFELSQEKVRIQRDDYVRMARELMKELNQ